jgi:hypothetical protein
MKGQSNELLNMGTINNCKIVFPEIRIPTVYSFGDLVQEIIKKFKQNIENNAIYIFLENETLKYFLFPVLRLRDIDPKKLNIQNYLKGVSVDILNIFKKITKWVENKPHHKTSKIEKLIIVLQGLLDKKTKSQFQKKYKQLN